MKKIKIYEFRLRIRPVNKPNRVPYPCPFLPLTSGTNPCGFSLKKKGAGSLWGNWTAAFLFLFPCRTADFGTRSPAQGLVGPISALTHSRPTTMGDPDKAPRLTPEVSSPPPARGGSPGGPVPCRCRYSVFFGENFLQKSPKLPRLQGLYGQEAYV